MPSDPGPDLETLNAALEGALEVTDLGSLIARLLRAYSEDIQRELLASLLDQLDPGLPALHDDRALVRLTVRPGFASRVLVSLAAATPKQSPLVTLDIAAERWSKTHPVLSIQTEVDAGRILALTIGDELQLPAFQFRQTSVATVRRVNTRLGARSNPWGVLAWWAAPNYRLEGLAPAQALSGPRKDGGRAIVSVAEAALEVVG